MKPKNPLPTVNFFTKATASVLVLAITMQSCVLQSASTNMDFKDDISDDAITHTDVKHVASSRLELGPLNASRNRVSRQSASASSNSSGSSLLVKGSLIALGLFVGAGAAFGGAYAYYDKVVSDYKAELSQANTAFHTCNSELNGYVVKNTRLLQTGNSPTYSYRPGCKDRLYGFFDPTTNAHIFGYKSLSDGNNTFIPNATTVSPLYQNASEVVTPEGSLNKLYGTSGCESALKSLIETSTPAQSHIKCMNDLYGTGPTDPGCENLLKTNTSDYPWGTPPIGCQDSLNTSQVSYNSCSNQLATSQASNLNLTSLYNTCSSNLNTVNAELLSCQQNQPAVDCAAQFGTSCSACISNVTCTNCTTGLYPKSGNPGCATCASLYSNCASCTSNLVGTTSCATCNAGYYLNGTNCSTCATGCNACTSATLCTSCSTNLFLSNSSCVNCGAAIANCASCTKTGTGTASCNACTAGYYLSGSACNICPASLSYCLACSNSTTCTSCATGYAPATITGGATCTQITSNQTIKDQILGIFKKLEMSDLMNTYILTTLTSSNTRIQSTAYRWPDFIKAFEYMAFTGIGGNTFYTGDTVEAGLINFAIFLGQSMHETIQYDACDENNWTIGLGVPDYPASAACGQAGQDYSQYKCSITEKKMECPIDPNMMLVAKTHATWYGAPAPLFCAPNSITGGKTPKWSTSAAWCDPAAPNNVPSNIATWINNNVVNLGTCSAYTGQKDGAFSRIGCPAEGCPNTAQMDTAGGTIKTDVEGCCWWGRGIIQTTGPCNIGKLNYYMTGWGYKLNSVTNVWEKYLYNSAAKYSDINFCEDPGEICNPNFPERKIEAGMMYWIESMQGYSSNSYSWNYTSILNANSQVIFANPNGSEAKSLVDAASGIVNRGCPQLTCPGSGAVLAAGERFHNFKDVMAVLKYMYDPVNNPSPSTILVAAQLHRF